MDVTLFVVPIVGQPIDVRVKQNPHLKNLELADWADQGSTLEVDALTGSDHYCAILS